jgi:hypothetical protein
MRAAIMIAAVATLVSPAARADSCHLITRFERNMAVNDAYRNRDAQGRPLLADYSEAARLIEQGLYEEALPFLDRAALNLASPAYERGFPEHAEAIADLIRSCPAWLPQPKPML